MPGSPNLWWGSQLPKKPFGSVGVFLQNPMHQNHLYTIQETESSQEDGRKKAAPFQVTINCCHMLRSLKKPEVSLMW